MKTRQMLSSVLLPVFVAFLFLSFHVHAQVGVNNDNSLPDPSAGLDVKFSDKGALLPRMTMAQRDSIVNPANGLIIICTDCGAGGMMNIFLEGSWKVTSLTPCTPTTPAEGAHTALDKSIAWNWNTVTGAAGYKWNTSNDYATATDMGYSTSKTETGLTCNTSYTRYVWSYNGCGNSTPVTLTKSTLACFTCGNTITVNHVAGAVAPVTKTVTYGTVGDPAKCWITRNLGASQVATNYNDNTEASAGWYWQFNHKQGYKHDGTTRTPNTPWVTGYNENSDWLAINDPCNLELGSSWRIVTLSELGNLDGYYNWTTWTMPYNSSLKLHAAGALNWNNGPLQDRGIVGWYVSSIQVNNVQCWVLIFGNGFSYIHYGTKGDAFPLRCVKE